LYHSDLVPKHPLLRQTHRGVYPPHYLYNQATEKADKAETVRVNVFNPEGSQVATGQTTLEEETVKIQISAGDNSDGIWSLELTRADDGALEDYSIILDPKIPPVLSLNPGHVFGVRKK
jgi:hypothetical protein